MTNPYADCLPECKTARAEREAMTQKERNAEDFKKRRAKPGVFYATGLGETQLGVEGDGRTIGPAEWNFVRGSTKNFGDGKGSAWVETDPEICLSAGPCRGQRRMHRLGANSDWNVRAWGQMPLDWLEKRENGAVLPVATRRIDPSLPPSKWNPKGLTVARRVFISWAYYADPKLLHENPTYWLQQAVMEATGAKGARPGLHTNKLVFPTGGQSSDQVAMTYQRLAGGIKTLFYNGNSTNSISPQLVKDLFQPGGWYTFEMLISDQVDAAANDDRLIKATAKGGLGWPRFVALWAARYGEPPQLIGYTNHNADGQGPAMVPSRLTDDRPAIFKYQDANIDDYALVPAVIVGSESGFPDPTPRSFYALRYLKARTLKSRGGAADTLRYVKAKNSHFRPGRLDGWGDGHTVGFSSGELAGTAYIPKRKDGATLTADELKSHLQYEIARTSYAGAQLAAPDGIADYVHLIELAEDMPVTPKAGDCFVVNLGFPRHHGTERLPGYPEKCWYYDELIFSVQPSDFPHQAGVPLPMPWLE